MRNIFVTFAALGLGLAAAGGVSAATSDAQYIQAKRCAGIAKGLGVASPELAAFVKAEGRTRVSAVMDLAQQAEDRAKRAARDPDAKAKFEAELSGACVAYGGGQATAVATH